jgi:tripartite-type tricarboxylate transporter receptor subunit TctC
LILSDAAVGRAAFTLGMAMKLARRRLLHFGFGAAALQVLTRSAMAQAYPSRPVHLISTFAVGGVNDLSARLIGQALSERLGQQFVVENRTGAGGNIGTELVVKAAPDGYTLLLTDISNAVNTTLYDNLSFNFLRDMVPVAAALLAPNILVVHPAFPVTTVPELIAYARANPGKVTMAGAGIGSMPHMCGELFKLLAGVNIVQVQYRGAGPALIDMLGGQTQVMFPNSVSSMEYIKAGKLRPLAVTAAARSEMLPDIPPLGELLPGYEASYWDGFAAPKNTPPQIVDKLNNEINGALADPRIKSRLGELGATAIPGSPADFRKLIADETQKWAKVVRAANLKAE